MKVSRSITALLLAIQVLFVPGVNCVTLSISSGDDGLGTVSSSMKLSAPDDAYIKSSAVLSFDKSASLSQDISGSGGLSDRRSVKNAAGTYAEVGVDITNAGSYVYSYSLSPGEGTWSACKYHEVSAREYLDVINAKYINVYALARNPKGMEAVARTEVYDEMNEASLIGYENKAVSTKFDKVSVTQSADKVIGIASPSAFAKDKSGKGARTQASFIGVYQIMQSASLSKSTVKADQSVNGDGYFNGATTSANYGNGNEAKAGQVGAFSGHIVNYVQSASASSSKSAASQTVKGFEYAPVTHGMGGYDWHILATFCTFAKGNSGKQATAQVDVTDGESYKQSQSSSVDSLTAKAQNDFDIVGMASTFGSVKDKSGKEAEALSGFVGVYHDEQSLSIGKSTAKSSQSLNGVGYFTDALTSAKDGKGKEAKSEQLGVFSGNMVNNIQSASADSTKSQACQKVDDLEYMPVEYLTGKYNQLIDVTFCTFVKGNSGKQATAQVDVTDGERYKQSQSSSVDSSIAKAQNDFDITGEANAFGLAKDESGREAKTGTNFIGVFSEDQYASLGRTTLKATHSLVGVGYLAGAVTSANGGKDKLAIAQYTGKFSGNVIKNEQSVSMTNSKSIAGQEATLEYLPVSYYGDYDASSLTFDSLSQYGKKNKFVIDDKTGIFGKIRVKESVFAP